MEAENVESLIHSFLALGYPRKELILCAGGSDGTFDAASRCANEQVVLLEQRPGEGKQQALRRCLAASDGALIYLTDADCLFTDEAFLRLIEPLVLGQSRVVTGVSKPKSHLLRSTLVQYQWFSDVVWSHQLPRITDGVLGRNCALHRSVLEDVGGFDTPAQTGTDYVLSRLLVRAGYEIQTVTESCVATEYPSTPQSYLRMWRRWNKNLLVQGARFGAWRDVTGVLVAFTLYSLILLTPLLVPVLGAVAWATSLLLFSTASVNRFRRLAIGAQLASSGISWKWFIVLPLCTTLDMLAVLLAVCDSVVPKLRSRW